MACNRLNRLAVYGKMMKIKREGAAMDEVLRCYIIKVTGPDGGDRYVFNSRLLVCSRSLAHIFPNRRAASSFLKKYNSQGLTYELIRMEANPFDLS